MILFDDVSLSFAGKPLFQHASFTLQRNERCGLVGRNGSGKTTIMRLITRQMEPDSGRIAMPKDYKIGYLEQHIQFTKPTLLEEAALGLPPGEEDNLYQAEAILFGLGFSEEDLDAPPSKFSGGYQLRLHLAKVLISQPNCLLLDEPTNYLDIVSINWLQRFLRSWKGEFFLISHDREFMDSVTTHTFGIHRERLKKVKGSTIDYFQQVLFEEEVHEKTRVKQEKVIRHAQSYIERFGAKASKATQAQSRVKKLEKIPVLEKLMQLENLQFSFHEAPFPGRKMLEAAGVFFSYSEDPLIQDVSLEIENGDRVAIIGKNGRGKSTLLRLIAQDLTPLNGEVRRSDNVRFGYFGQTHIDHLDRDNTIEKEIGEANPALNFSEVKAIAGLMMFSGDLSKKKISVLSGGEKSRVLLGKILAKPCNLLLLDEPTHHLDMESIEALIDALEEFSGAVVIVTHSELILRRLNLTKLIICEDQKQTVFLGNYDEFLEKLGWEHESGSTSSKKPQEQPKQVVPTTKNLKPIEKEIRTCEEKIIALEAEQEADQQLLEDPTQLQDKLIAIGRRQKQIEEMYAQLQELFNRYDAMK